MPQFINEIKLYCNSERIRTDFLALVKKSNKSGFPYYSLMLLISSLEDTEKITNSLEGWVNADINNQLEKLEKEKLSFEVERNRHFTAIEDIEKKKFRRVLILSISFIIAAVIVFSKFIIPELFNTVPIENSMESQKQTQDLEVIKAMQSKKGMVTYETNLENYKSNSIWRTITMPIGEGYSTSELEPQGKNDYFIENISDFDLSTAWIEGETGYGQGVQFGFKFNYLDNVKNGGNRQFSGHINLFNGYCKSISSWSENSRVKSLKVYYNEIPICIVELLDTWHFQYFDIGIYFESNLTKNNMDEPYEIKKGDKLVFEILDIYKGSKYKDAGISEFVVERVQL